MIKIPCAKIQNYSIVSNIKKLVIVMVGKKDIIMKMVD